MPPVTLSHSHSTQAKLSLQTANKQPCFSPESSIASVNFKVLFDEALGTARLAGEELVDIESEEVQVAEQISATIIWPNQAKDSEPKETSLQVKSNAHQAKNTL